MDRILITGGTGFVGYWMQQVSHGPKDLYFSVLSHEAFDRGDWEDQSWNYIVHLAPVAPYSVIGCAMKCGARVLFASSGAVYNRNTEYARNKRTWEHFCMDSLTYSKVDVVVARLFTFYGKHLDDDKALTKFIKSAKAGEPIRIYGDGNTVRSYMNGDEMGKWMWAILFKGQSGEAYDVGSDKPVTMLELAQMVNKTFGNRSEIIIENKPEECPYYMPKDLEKTRRLLRA